MSAQVTRNETVVELINEIRGMIFNFARKFNLEFDDCFQHVSLFLLELWPRIPSDCRNIKAYLCGAAKRELYEFLRHRGQETLSLDAPITPDSTETFADMLQAFVQKRDEEREDFVEQVTHAALKQCKLEEQMYAREKYELNSFNPVLPHASSQPNYHRRGWNMKRSITTTLSKNAQVLALMRS